MVINEVNILNRLIHIFLTGLLLCAPGFPQKYEDNRLVDAGDILKINLPSAEDLNGFYDVDIQGRIFMPLIGYFSVDQQSVGEIKNKLADSLSIYVKNTQALQVKIHQKNKIINVLGYVGKPGIVTVEEQASLQEVLNRAGGLLNGALLNRLEIQRPTTLGIQTIGVKYNDFLLSGDFELLPPLKSGDTIFIPKGLMELNTGERLVYVFGAVSRPGAYEITDQTTLLDAISQAGGTSTNANLKNIQIVRNNTIAGEKVIKINLKEFVKQGNISEIPLVESGDSIFVEEKKQHWLVLGMQITSSIVAVYGTILILQTKNRSSP